LASGYAVVPKRRAKRLAAEAGFKAFELGATAAARRKMEARLAMKSAVPHAG
jgi:hypothetical protein